MPLLGRVLDAYPKTADGYALEGYSAMLLVLLLSAMAAFIATLFMTETFQK